MLSYTIKSIIYTQSMWRKLSTVSQHLYSTLFTFPCVNVRQCWSIDLHSEVPWVFYLFLVYVICCWQSLWEKNWWELFSFFLLTDDTGSGNFLPQVNKYGIGLLLKRKKSSDNARGEWIIQLLILLY